MYLKPLILLCSLSLFGCGDPAAYSEAKELERQVLVGNPAATYADAAYLRVAKKLAEVPSDSSDYERSQELLGQIQDARRLQLSQAYNLPYKPERLEGKQPADYRANTEGVVQVAARKISQPMVAKSQTPPEEAALGSVVGADSIEPVILYSTSWCGYCKRARKYFSRNNIPFVEKDIEKDRMAANEVRSKVGGYSGVPVIDVDGTIIRGYNLPAIKKALAAREPEVAVQ